MLLQFGVKNFRSFRDFQTLSLIADQAIKDGNSSLRHVRSESLNEATLPVAMIYGANASGKSNLVKALAAMRRFVLFSHSETQERKIEFVYDPFVMSNQGPIQPTLFEIDFVHNKIRYNYSFEILLTSVVSERLYFYPRGRRVEIFDRDSGSKESIKIGSSIKGALRHMAQFVRPDSLFVSTATQNASEEVAPLAEFFRSLVVLPMGDRFRFRRRPETFDKRIVSFLGALDTGISGHRFTKIPTDDEVRRFYANAQHDFSPPDNYSLEFSHRSSDGDDVFFKLSQESDGTKRLVDLLQFCLSRLDNGGVLVIDELDASLHSRVAESIIELFTDPEINKSGAQLIATTHDTNLMTSDLLRRDQIWFAEKSDGGASSLYPLTDFRTRKTDNIEKGYLQGRYGAVPYGGSIARLLRRIES